MFFSDLELADLPQRRKWTTQWTSAFSTSSGWGRWGELFMSLTWHPTSWKTWECLILIFYHVITNDWGCIQNVLVNLKPMRTGSFCRKIRNVITCFVLFLCLLVHYGKWSRTALTLRASNGPSTESFSADEVWRPAVL